MGKLLFIFCLSLLGAAVSDETNKETDNVAESSVTSYSNVVIHTQPGKKSNLMKEGEEGRSTAYFKVKRLKASTVPPSASNVQQNGHNGGEFRLQNIEAKSHKEDFRAQNSDFRPSQYLPEPELRVSFRGTKDQSVQAARHSEYRQRENDRARSKFKEDAERENWNDHYNQEPRFHSNDERKHYRNQEDAPRHREIFRETFPVNSDEDRPRQPHSQQQQQPNFHQSFTFDKPNSGFSEIRHPFQQIQSQHEPAHHQQALPPGMSPELIETLLSQQPQTFDSERKQEPRKKSKSQTFKVGYSIGFGGGEDVIVGRPKDSHLHVNGRNSVWKTLQNGVEMSQEVDNRQPIALKLRDNSKSNENVLKNDVYYMNNYRPDTSVPTSGRSSFNHAQALTNSNSFDFSNAVEPTPWLKDGRALDVGNIYQSLGYPPPLPVMIPGSGPHGEGSMVQAIVIPIESLAGLDYTSHWAGLSQVPMVPIAAQPVAQALTLNPVVTAAPLVSQGPQHHSSQQHHSLQQHHTSSPHHHRQEKPRFKGRTPKAKDLLKQGSYNSAPIVVAPAPSHRQAELQKELNNILAEEMSRKNHRMPSVGLRPPSPY